MPSLDSSWTNLIESWILHTRNSPVAGCPAWIDSRPVPGDGYVSTAQVCEAAGISSATALRWSKASLLPPYERIHGGKRGQYARWPAHTPEQAKWVKAQLAKLFSREEIVAKLAAGEFVARNSE